MSKATETKQFEAAIAPVVAFNQLVVKNAETAFNMQMASLQAYAKLGLENMSAGLEVRNPDDFKAYAEKQKNVAEEITARVTSDVKAFGELNAQFIEEARDLAENNVKTVSAAVKKAA
ncbi:MAG: phasin family protein [Arenicellales bacterium]